MRGQHGELFFFFPLKQSFSTILSFPVFCCLPLSGFFIFCRGAREFFCIINHLIVLRYEKLIIQKFWIWYNAEVIKNRKHRWLWTITSFLITWKYSWHGSLDSWVIWKVGYELTGISLFDWAQEVDDVVHRDVLCMLELLDALLLAWSISWDSCKSMYQLNIWSSYNTNNFSLSAKNQ